MAEQKIELRKIRDFGQNFSDTFLFLRQNFKPLLKSFLAICGLFMLAHAITLGIYQSHSLSGFGEIFRGAGKRRSTYSSSPYAYIFSIEYFLMWFFKFLTYMSMQTVLGAYFKFYIQSDGQRPGMEDIWRIFRQYFLKVVAYNIPVTILIFLGFCLCAIPGIYLWVVWLPYTLVIMMEDTTFNGAFNRCFEIIRENFWTSFAIYLVAIIIYWISSLIIGVLTGIIIAATAFLSIDNFGVATGVITPFLDIFSFIFYIVFFIVVSLQYFTLVEQRDGTGILSRIDNIGTEKNMFDNIEEQY